MVSSAEITREAANITHQAELGRPSDLQHVHDELQNDMKSYSPCDYNQLLNSIKQQNGADQKANSHLPSLQLYDSTGGNTPDSIKAKYSDGTTMTANGPESTGTPPAHGPGDGSTATNGSTSGGAGGGSDSAAGGYTGTPTAHGPGDGSTATNGSTSGDAGGAVGASDSAAGGIANSSNSGSDTPPPPSGGTCDRDDHHDDHHDQPPPPPPGGGGGGPNDNTPPPPGGGGIASSGGGADSGSDAQPMPTGVHPGGAGGAGHPAGVPGGGITRS